MASFQSIAENLLLETGASRVLLQLAASNGEPPFAAEAVTHGVLQIRNDRSVSEDVRAAAYQEMEHERRIVTQDDIEQPEPPFPRVLIDRYGVRARVHAPLVRGTELLGVLLVHHALGPRHWQPQDVAAVGKAQAATLSLLQAQASHGLGTTMDELRDTGIQAILDHLRSVLRVPRCTLRQNVNAAYAFPVTHESRDEGVRSLLGDFTIIQSGQPVIERMLAERVQVVQNDTRAASTEHLFHVMLQHYGDMRSQIVTPLFHEDSLAAVLSVHSLQELRTWTSEEIGLARSAARLLGLLTGATLA